MRKIFGYCRVSSVDQNVERQIEAVSNFALEKYGIELDYHDSLFVDQCSGKDFNRNAWIMLEMQLRQDDVLIIKELDRLGRNKEMITEVLQLVDDLRHLIASIVQLNYYILIVFSCYQIRHVAGRINHLM